MEREKQLEYNRPWILQRADPYVYRHTDGWYYFYGIGTCLRRDLPAPGPKTLAELRRQEEVEVWHKHESGIMSEHIWAPELHYLFGKWYLYLRAEKKKMYGKYDRMSWSARTKIRLQGPGKSLNDETAGEDEFSFTAFSLD